MLSLIKFKKKVISNTLTFLKNNHRTHLELVTQYGVNYHDIIGTGNDLPSSRRQAVSWNNVD